MARPAGKKKLSAQQRRFISEFLIDKNATRAALRAGYAPRSAQQQGSRLMLKDVVRDEIEKRLENIFRLNQIKVREVIEELTSIGLSNPQDMLDEEGRLLPLKDMPPHIARAVASVKPTQWGREVKLWDKNIALTNLAKYFKLLVERREVTVTTDLASRLRAARKRAQKERGA